MAATAFDPSVFLWLSRRHDRIEEEALDVEPIEQALYEVLREYAADLAFALDRDDPDQALTPAAEHPGYLTATIGAWQVFVPWLLVPSFPRRTIVAELLEMGERVAIRPISSICISGSSTMLGTDIEIGDIDYSEYIEQPPSMMVESTDELTVAREGPILVTISYADLNAPQDVSWAELRARMSIDASIDEAKRLKLEFLGAIAHVGVVPISTIVLSSDFSDRTRGQATKSFVYQEAVGVPRREGTPAPPWSLIVPEEVGHYVSFLRQEVLEYAPEQPIKAVKRAFALARTIGLHDLGDRALAILTSAESRAYIRRKRRQDVREHFERCGVENRAVLADVYPSLIEPEQDDLSAPDDIAPTQCAELLRQLEHEINAIETHLPNLR